MGFLVDREHLYRFLWENSNRHNFILLTQQQVSKQYGIGYQRLSEIYLEFQETGRMKKYSNRFQIKDPDTLDWSEEYSKEAKSFRSERGR